MLNPFYFGGPIPSDRFIGRRRELSRIARRLCNGGQSSALTGEPRSGKTSVLTKLHALSVAGSYFGEGDMRMLWQYVDAQNLPSAMDLTAFWEQALTPVRDLVAEGMAGREAARAYRAGRKQDFSAEALEKLLDRLHDECLRLVILIDEVDQLIHHPRLNTADFYGGLRSLASRKPALAVVIAGRQSIARLNKATQNLNPTGSPFFNYFDEYHLGPLTAGDTEWLLARADERFDTHDKAYIVELAGGQPYLLQLTASRLWDAYEDGLASDERYREVGQQVYDQAAATISDAWRLWPTAKRKVFASIALAHLGMIAEGQQLLERHTFYVDRLLADLHSFGSERHALNKQGFIVEDERVAAGWRVGAQIYLWWMAEEVVRTVRDDTPFEDWLGAQEWGSLMTSGEREQLKQAAHSVGGFLKSGVNTLIESVAKGLAGGVGGA